LKNVDPTGLDYAVCTTSNGCHGYAFSYDGLQAWAYQSSFKLTGPGSGDIYFDQVDAHLVGRWALSAVGVIVVVRALALVFTRVFGIPYPRRRELVVGLSGVLVIFAKDFWHVAAVSAMTIGANFYNQWSMWRDQQKAGR